MRLADELEELALPLLDSGQAGFVVALARKATEAVRYMRDVERRAYVPPKESEVPAAEPAGAHLP